MFDRVHGYAQRFRSTLTSEQRRTVWVLGVLSTIVLIGLAATGVWQLIAHRSDPNWFDHLPGSSARQQTAPSTGVAALHGTFSTAAGALSLIGGAWYAYRVAFTVPWLWVTALACAIAGSITGSLIRFNAIRLRGQSYEDAGSGYLQLFTNDVEVVVTDRWDLGAWAIRSLTLMHVLPVPVLVALIWMALGRAEQDAPTSLPA